MIGRLLCLLGFHKWELCAGRYYQHGTVFMYRCVRKRCQRGATAWRKAK
jgi:hypothetical protein